MTTYRLDPFTCTNYDGTTDYGDTTWSDGNWTTYATIGYSDDPDAVGNIPAYTGGVITSMAFHLTAAVSTGTLALPLIYQLDRNSSGSRMLWSFGGSTDGRQSQLVGSSDGTDPPPLDWIIPGDGLLREFVVYVDDATLIENGWDAGGLDELRDDLAGGTCRLYVWADGFADGSSPVGHIQVFEAWLAVGDDSTFTGAPKDLRRRFS